MKTEVPENVVCNDKGGLNDVNKYLERGNVTRERAIQMTTKEAGDNPDVVSSAFTLNSLPVCVLFDSGATFSFVWSRFAKRLKCH